MLENVITYREDEAVRAIKQDKKAVWLDKEILFKQITPLYADERGYKNAESAIGTTIEAMPCQACELAPQWRDIHKDVIETQRQLKLINVHRVKDGQWNINISLTTAVVRKDDDSSQDVVVGTYTGIRDISHHYAPLYSLLFRHPSDKKNEQLNSLQLAIKLGQPFSEMKLTRPEQKVLFWLLRGFDVKMIAMLLNKGKSSCKKIRTTELEALIESLAHKFTCSQDTLIDKAEALGYRMCIPEHMFNKQLITQLESYR